MHCVSMHTHSSSGCNHELQGSVHCCRKCLNCYDYTRLCHDYCDYFFDDTHYATTKSRRRGGGRRSAGCPASLTTRNLSCMSFPFRVSWANFLWCLWVTPVLSRTACSTGAPRRAQAMDAGCGSSTYGHWDGPVTCNKSHCIARERAG